MRFGQRSGFAYVEILVALLLLSLAAVAMLPLFTFVSQATAAERARLVAGELARSVLEKVRALPYNQVGVQGGNPEGVLPAGETVVLGGVTYHVETSITWVDDPSDNDSGGDPIASDYKKVRVRVTAPGFFSGAVEVSAEISSLVAQEGEEEAFPGGNLKGLIYRGWRTGLEDIPVESMPVELLAGPDAPQQSNSDETGGALFTVLQEGDYLVRAKPARLGLMLQPPAVPRAAQVTFGKTTQVVFIAEYPCRVQLQLKNASGAAAAVTSGLAVLHTPFAGDLVKNFSSDDAGRVDSAVWGDLWPVGAGSSGGAYDLEILARGFLPYRLQYDQERPWDGVFNGPGQQKSLVIRLQPSTAEVLVRDSISGRPVSGATVRVYKHTWRYEVAEDGTGGSWQDVGCSVQPVDEAVTGLDGRAAFQLADSAQPPDAPQGGDTFTRYCVEVVGPANDQGVNLYNPQPFRQHSAFVVRGGRQNTLARQLLDGYAVNLTPAFCQIRVLVTDTAGFGVNGLPLRLEKVTGGAVQEDVTGVAQGAAPGEVLFDVAAGTYKISRREYWYWGNWVEITRLDVSGGQVEVPVVFQ